VLSSQTGGVQTNRSVLCTDNGQGVYAVWEEYYGLDIHIYFRRSLDDGLTWQDAVLVAGSTTAAAQATYPSIMVDKGLLHLLWYDQYTGQVLYRKGPADGSTLSTPLALNVSGQAEAPNLAISGNGIVAYWQDPSLEKIKYVQSADSGESWFNAQTLGNADNNNCSAPKLVIDANQNLYAVWSQPDQVVFQKVDAVLGALSPMTVSTQPGTSFHQPAPTAGKPGERMPALTPEGRSNAPGWWPTGEIFTFSMTRETPGRIVTKSGTYYVMIWDRSL
jgi:hypothetical protein